MKLYGIQGTANQWFHDYLPNRYQYVTYSGVKSKQEIITCGVPQGSILGPLLVLLYVNDLYLVTKASLPVLFAHDTNIFITGKNSKEMCDKINEDLENIREWLCCNKLSLNILKTHYMVFTPRNKIVNDIDICINDVRIERVYVTKFLGIQIDSLLNWKKHIDYICKKLSRYVGIIAKARKNYINPLSLLCITHLHIPISSTVTMCREILLKLEKKNGIGPEGVNQDYSMLTLPSTHWTTSICK